MNKLRLTYTNSERGSMLIEVMVAVIVIGIIVTSLAMSFAVSSKHNLRNQIRAKQYNVADGAMERIRTRAARWLPSCTVSPCTICPGAVWTISGWNYGTNCPVDRALATDPKHLDENNRPSAFDVRATATAVDTTSDGVGPDDQDANTKDAYRIAVTVTPLSNSLKANVSRTNGGAISTTTVIDPNGSTGTGTLRVVVCLADNQIDERSAVNIGQDSAGAVGSAQCNASVSSFLIGKNLQCGAWDCQAFDQAASFAPQSPPGKFRLSGFKQPTSGVPVSIAGVPYTTNPQGVLTVNNLTSGLKGLVVTPPSGYKVWESHSIPSAMNATVEAGKINTSYIMLRPLNTGASFRIYVRQIDVSDPWDDRRTGGYPAQWGMSPACPGEPISRITFKLMSAPLGRTNIDNAAPWHTVRSASVGSCTAPPLATQFGARWVDIQNVDTGLYMMKALRYPGGNVYDITACPGAFNLCTGTVPAWNVVTTGSPSRFIWIDKNGAQHRPRNAMITVIRCRPSVRNALIATYCYGAPSCWAELTTTPGYKKHLKPCGSDIQPPVAYGAGGV